MRFCRICYFVVSHSTALLMGLTLMIRRSSLSVFMAKDLAQYCCALVGCCFTLLSEVLSNLEAVKSPSNIRLLLHGFGSHLLSHTVASAVPSAVQGLTIVFEMGTGVSPKRIATKNLKFPLRKLNNRQHSLLLSSLERR